MSGFQRCVRYCILLLIPLSAIAGFGLAVVFMGLGHASRIHYEIAIPVTLAFSLPNVLAFFSFGRRNILAHGYIVLYFLAHLALCVYTYMLIKNNIGAHIDYNGHADYHKIQQWLKPGAGNQ